MRFPVVFLQSLRLDHEDDRLSIARETNPGFGTTSFSDRADRNDS